MLRTLNFLLIGLMLIGAGVVYDLKYEAERASAKVAKINRKIETERDAIATLKAEWSLLNQPKRLQELVTRYRSYLELDPLDPTQIATLDDIPFKPAVPSAGALPQTTPKGSVKLAQPDKPVDHGGSIGKMVDRLPAVKGGGPTTTGSVPKPASGAPLSIVPPMQLVPRTVAPKAVEPQPKVTR